MCWSHFKPSLEATTASNSYLRLNELAMNQQLMCFIKKKKITKQTPKTEQTTKKNKARQKNYGSPQTVTCVVAKAIDGEKYDQGMLSFFFLSLVWGVVGEVWSNHTKKVLLWDLRQREHCLSSEIMDSQILGYLEESFMQIFLSFKLIWPGRRGMLRVMFCCFRSLFCRNTCIPFCNS